MTTTTAPGGTSTAAASRRLDGVDVARGLAIVGMVTVHFGPPTPIEAVDATAWVYASFAGKASLLFALVAGVGISLLSRRRSDRVVRARMVYRTVWLLPLGVWLQSLDHPVAVILQYYGVWFALAAPFVGASPVTQRRWAAVLAVVGSAAALWSMVVHPEWVVPMRGDSPGGLLADLLVFGYYPSVTWFPVVLFGMALGQTDLSATRTRTLMVVGGAAALVGSTWTGRVLASGMDVRRGTWSWVVTTEAHSQMPLWLLGGVGFAVAVLGSCLALADRLPGASRPLADLGRLALSVYVAHLLIFHVTEELFVARSVGEGVRTVLAFGAVSALTSTLWLRVFRRGPLEALVRAGWGGVRRALPDDGG